MIQQKYVTLRNHKHYENQSFILKISPPICPHYIKSNTFLSHTIEQSVVAGMKTIRCTCLKAYK